MLSLEELQVISQRANEQRSLLNTEESVKTALVLPLIGALGYDYHNPSEVAAELAADVGTRSHEKVDYAILRDGKPIILVECKALANSLGAGEMSQLTRYFNNTDADIGILTNGVVYKFFSDLDKSNIMDQSPFLEVDISKANQSVVAELRRFAKGSFHPEKTKTAAMEANVIRGVKANLQRMYDNPEDEFSRTLLRDVVAGSLTKRVVESHRELVKRAFQEFARDLSNTGSSREFPQEASPSEPQSDPRQAQAANPPSALPAPNGEWRPLSEAVGIDKTLKLQGIMFPDGSSVTTSNWNELTVEVVRWLNDNNRLPTPPFRIRTPKSETRYVVAEQAIRPSGEHHAGMTEVADGVWVISNLHHDTAAGNARYAIEHERVGMDSADFKVLY